MCLGSKNDRAAIQIKKRLHYPLLTYNTTSLCSGAEHQYKYLVLCPMLKGANQNFLVCSILIKLYTESQLIIIFHLSSYVIDKRLREKTAQQQYVCQMHCIYSPIRKTMLFLPESRSFLRNISGNWSHRL